MQYICLFYFETSCFDLSVNCQKKNVLCICRSFYRRFICFIFYFVAFSIAFGLRDISDPSASTNNSTGIPSSPANPCYLRNTNTTKDIVSKVMITSSCYRDNYRYAALIIIVKRTVPLGEHFVHFPPLLYSVIIRVRIGVNTVKGKVG